MSTVTIAFHETSVTTTEAIAADYDASGQLAGIEILDAVKRFGGQETRHQVVIEGIGLAMPLYRVS